MIAPSHEVAIDPAHAALLIVDVQNYCAHVDGSAWHRADEQKRGYFFRSLRQTVVPNLQLLQRACRQAQIEVVYAAVENMLGMAATAASTTRSPASTWRVVLGTRKCSPRSRRQRTR